VLDRLDGNFNEVYHLAAILGVENVMGRPVDVLRVNAMGTMLLLDWLTRGGGNKVLFASTSEVYAWTQQFHTVSIPTPEDVPLALTDLGNPRSSYAGSKIFGELAVTQWCRANKAAFVIVRYHNIYGPRMGEDHVIPQMFKRASVDQENPLAVYSSNHSRAFCYVSDAVNATICAMRTPAAEGCTINIGNDEEEVVIADLARKILRWSGIEAVLEPRVSSADPIKRRCPNITKARKVLGYSPMVHLDQGLDLTLRWYTENFAKRDCVSR
jgi:UDP-glucose 4-epimerase/UDP-glucuronate decarboxylase